MEAHRSCWDGLSSHMRVCCHPVSPGQHLHWYYDWSQMPIQASLRSSLWHTDFRGVPQTSSASLHMVIKFHTRIIIAFLSPDLTVCPCVTGCPGGIDKLHLQRAGGIRKGAACRTYQLCIRQAPSGSHGPGSGRQHECCRPCGHFLSTCIISARKGDALLGNTTLDVTPAHCSFADACLADCMAPISNLCDSPSPRCSNVGQCNCLQGCHAALLQHQDLAADRGISGALNSILRQFSSLDTDACDTEVCEG